MATYLLYEKLHGRIKQREAKKFPVNEDAFGWVEHTLRKGQPELDFDHWIVVQGELTDISETLENFVPAADDVKLECYHRILAVVPVWQQQNKARRWTELKLKATRTADETTELAALDALFAWIDSMRAKSNELEATPERCFDDASWPAAPAGA